MLMRMDFKRGQASTETLFVVGFAMVLIFVLMYVVMPAMLDFTQFSAAAQTEQSLDKIVSVIDSASSYGPGTEVSLNVYLPAGTLHYDDPNLVFDLPDGKQIVKPLSVELNPFSPIDFKASGIKKIRIRKDMDSVHLQIS